MAVFMLDDVAGGVEVVVFPETFGEARIARRSGCDAAGARQVREGRGVGAARGDRADADGGAEGAHDARGGHPPVGPDARPRRSSKRSPSCSRGIAAIAASTSSSTCPAPARRCAFAPTSRSGSGRPNAWSSEVEQLCGAGSVELTLMRLGLGSSMRAESPGILACRDCWTPASGTTSIRLDH